MKIRVKEYNNEDVRKLTERFSLSSLTARILSARGKNALSDDLLFILEKDILYLRSPFEEDDMPKAVDRIKKAIEKDEKIMVFGDKDADGITATALLIRGLEKIGAKNISYRVPEGEENYGLSLERAEEIASAGCTLLITVDSGITSYDEINYLREKNIDTIITDHHLPDEKIPRAIAVIDPQFSSYPFKGLSGSAVAAKLLWALFFSYTPLYNKEIVLFHAEPRNKTVRLTAILLENFVINQRVEEEVVEKEIGFEKTKVYKVLHSEKPIYVLDGDVERKTLASAFGYSLKAPFIDIRPKLEKVMSKAKNKSLFDLTNLSRASMYSDVSKEAECLLSLFKSIYLNSYKELSADFDQYLQIAAIGTVADLMPMNDENRIIVKRGLSYLSQSPSPFIFPLIRKKELHLRPITEKDISFSIAPPINASGRMGRPTVAISMLLSKDEGEAEGFADTLIYLNKERQRAEKEALESIREKIFFSYEKNSAKIIVVNDGAISRGLTGMLANRIVAEYSCPAIVIADGEGIVNGSMRVSGDYNAKVFLSNFSSLLENFGGHSKASGFTIKKENVPVFTEQVEKNAYLFDEYLKDEEIEVDAQLLHSQLSEELWEISSLLSPYGNENEKIVYLIRNAKLENVKTFEGKKLMRFNLRLESSSWPCVWWASHSQDVFKEGESVNAVFTTSSSWWKGTEKKELEIIQLEVC